MKVGIVVPGGLDPSGTERVIPALLWLIARVARAADVHAFAMAPAERDQRYELCGATVHAIGAGLRPARTAAALVAEHRRRPFDILHAFWATRCGTVAVPVARALRIPCIVHLAGGETAALPHIDYGDARTARGRAVLRRVLRAADQVTAPSRPIVEAAGRLGVHARRLPLGVDREAWPERPPRPRDPARPARLVHVASLNRVKDPFTLLAALAGLAPHHTFELDIAGEDTLGGAVEEAARRHGLDQRTRFHGFLPQSRLRPLVEAADIMVLSSLHEAGPVAVLEAAHAGVAIVGTAVGHLQEWAPGAASVAPPGDARSLGRAISGLLSDDMRRIRQASAAQALALAEDANATAAAVIDLYQILGDRSRAVNGHRTRAADASR